MTRRTEQVASLIQKELGELMAALEMPAMTTISKVEVSPDLKHARVWITVFTQDKKMEGSVLDFLHKHLFELQGELNRTFTMRNVPRVAFRIDASQQYASHINELLKKANEGVKPIKDLDVDGDDAEDEK